MKELRQISVIGMGLLGSSITLGVASRWGSIKTVGYGHRESTRRKARKLGVCDTVADSLEECVAGADMVILATPIRTFETIFRQTGGYLKQGCVVSDVGSTKVLPHLWARKELPGSVYYVGSHPIAGSEQRGVDFGRDDLFVGANCIITRDAGTKSIAIEKARCLWEMLGCHIRILSPSVHDRIYARVSHLPHVLAAALVNSSSRSELEFCGKGFMDTSRIASGPVNIWTDILLTNAGNTAEAIDRLIAELKKIKSAVSGGREKGISKLLEKAANKRAALIEYKIKNRELI